MSNSKQALQLTSKLCLGQIKGREKVAYVYGAKACVGSGGIPPVILNLGV
jgi:hypothetical protein